MEKIENSENILSLSIIQTDVFRSKKDLERPSRILKNQNILNLRPARLVHFAASIKTREMAGMLVALLFAEF